MSYYKSLESLDYKLDHFIFHSGIVNVCFGIALICYLIIFYKFYTTPDGKVRKAFLLYFGSVSFYAGMMAFVYKAMVTSLWVQFAFLIPHFIMLLFLTFGIFKYYGVRGQAHDNPRKD